MENDKIDMTGLSTKVIMEGDEIIVANDFFYKEDEDESY